MAVADFDCRKRSGYRQATDAAQLALAEQLVRDNRAELERLRDAISQHGDFCAPGAVSVGSTEERATRPGSP